MSSVTCKRIPTPIQDFPQSKFLCEPSPPQKKHPPIKNPSVVKPKAPPIHQKTEAIKPAPIPSSNEDPDPKVSETPVSDAYKKPIPEKHNALFREGIPADPQLGKKLLDYFGNGKITASKRGMNG